MPSRRRVLGAASTLASALALNSILGRGAAAKAFREGGLPCPMPTRPHPPQRPVHHARSRKPERHRRRRSRTAASWPSARTRRSWRWPAPDTKIVDLKGRRVLPGLIDNHPHIIRGGLNFNMELRWDGVR